MKALKLIAPLSSVLVACAWSAPVGSGTHALKAAQTNGTPAKPTIYVSDFELDVVPANAAAQAAPVAPPASPPAAQSGAKKPDRDAREQASQVVNLMSATLVAALRKAGYTAVRLHAGDARPDRGVGIRGIFAEVDKENHWRRAVIRTASDSGKMQALVGVLNLAKPDQALYEIAHLPGNESKPGAVITLSPYLPLTTYELDKDMDEAAFQKIASRIVTDLTALLNANPAAVAR